MDADIWLPAVFHAWKAKQRNQSWGRQQIFIFISCEEQKGGFASVMLSQKPVSAIYVWIVGRSIVGQNHWKSFFFFIFFFITSNSQLPLFFSQDLDLLSSSASFFYSYLEAPRHGHFSAFNLQSKRRHFKTESFFFFFFSLSGKHTENQPLTLPCVLSTFTWWNGGVLLDAVVKWKCH